MRKKDKKNGECFYCGLIGTHTEDEVIPQCIFKKPRPSNLIQVLACATCNNNEKSRDDSFLRDLILMDHKSMRNKTAEELFDTKVIRSFEGNHSKFARQTAPKAELLPFFNDEGKYLGEGALHKVDGETVHRIFSRIASGIYFWRTQQRIPSNCDFSVEQVSPEQFEEDKKLFIEFPHYYHVCRDEFTLIMNYNPTTDNT